MATGDLEREVVQTEGRSAPFWEVLERVAALGGDGARLRRPIPFEVVAEDQQAPEPSRVAEGPAPREVYHRLRSLLSDVDDLGDKAGPDDEPGDQVEPTPVGSSVAPASEEIDEPEGETPAEDGVPVEEARPSHDAPGAASDPSVSRPMWLAWQDVPEERFDGDPEVSAPEDAASEAAAGYGIGAHAASIPGTEEFMALLERKNRAFEETGEIDTDLDRAADRLAWDRASDDIIAKRRLFRKRRRD